MPPETELTAVGFGDHGVSLAEREDPHVQQAAGSDEAGRRGKQGADDHLRVVDADATTRINQPNQAVLGFWQAQGG